MTVVLDSWAVLALVDGDEPAAHEVERLLERERPSMSLINAGQVLYVLQRRHGADAASDTVRDLADVVDLRLPDEQLVAAAADVKATHSMSYADAFCAALARSMRAVVWTGDPELLIDGASWQWRDLRA